MKMLALPRYGRLGASSRLRTLQYLPWFERAGFTVQTVPLLSDDYVRAMYCRKHAPAAVLHGYAERLAKLFKAQSYDMIWTEKELLPWFPAFIELGVLSSSAKLVVDYDDAVFHRYDQHKSGIVRRLLGQKHRRVIGRSHLTIVGNRYLMDYANEFSPGRVQLVPTVIDLDKYRIDRLSSAAADPVVVGWIGTPSTAHYLQIVSEALWELSKRHHIRCIAVGARPDQLIGTPFEAVEWREESEVASLKLMNIGVMPLFDSPWEKGKCAYKLIQYMACGLPVVASAVGANCDVVRSGTGFLALTMADWLESLECLIVDADLRQRMGACGRDLVEREFSIQVHGPRLAGLLCELGSR
jgi:glycosyltransferase involved in cell wall biosynthesis